MEYFLGVLASMVAQIIKKLFGTDTLGTYVALGIVTLVCATVAVAFQDTPLWASFLQVLATAGAFHNFIIRRFE